MGAFRAEHLVWTPQALDRLRWACLGPPTIDRVTAMQRLANELNVSHLTLYAKAREERLIGTPWRPRA